MVYKRSWLKLSPIKKVCFFSETKCFVYIWYFPTSDFAAKPSRQGTCGKQFGWYGDACLGLRLWLGHQRHIEVGESQFLVPRELFGDPNLKRPWDQIYWGDKSIWKGSQTKKNNIYSSIRLSIYTGGFLDAKISKDTQGEWFVSKQPWKKFDGKINVTFRKTLGMNGARVNRIWFVVFGFEFLQWWNPFCHHSGRSPPGNESTYLTEEMENYRLNRGFCRRYVSSLECTISSYQLIMISAQFSFDFDLDSWSYEIWSDMRSDWT